MARLTWTPEAVSSIRDIYDFIARDRPETARRTVESILNKVDALAAYPDTGQPYRYTGSRLDVRTIQYGNFRVAYLVEDGEVVVLGVFHGLIFLPMSGGQI